MRTLVIVAGLVVSIGFAVYAGGPAELPDVPQKKLDKVEKALPEKPEVAPKKERKVLILWKCDGYFHGVIPLATEALKMLGEETGAYTSVIPQTQDEQMSYLTPEKLKEFDAIVFNNTTRLKPNRQQQEALLEFLESGKGIVGVHAATDNFYQWKKGARIMGGQFTNHPWHEDVPIRIDDPDHELCAMFDPGGFVVKDEIYQFNNGIYSRADQRVLLSLDHDKMGNKGDRADDDYAISWVKRYGKGRIFYCSFGHDDWIFWHPEILEHYLAGIQFALGDLPVNTEPNPLEAADLNPFMGLYEGDYYRGGDRYPAEARLADYANGNYKALVTVNATDRNPEGFSLELGKGMSANMPLYKGPDKGQKGVAYAYYEGDWDALPDFDKLEPVKQGVADTFTIAPRKRDDRFGFVFMGYLDIEEAGRYKFHTASDDGSRLWIDGKRIVDNDGLHGVVRKSGEVDLKSGMHTVRVDYFEKTGGEELNVGMASSGSAESAIVLQGNGMGTTWLGKAQDGMLIAEAKDPQKGRFELERVEAESPTAGLKAPGNAIDLLPRGKDGRPSLEEWTNKSWRQLADGSMEVVKGGNKTKREFGDMRLHLEFRCPYEPGKRGQSRGNSGVYIQDRYELQVLDSFGLPPAWNQCGGIYKVAVPSQAAELPPGNWQTYDVVFRTAKLDENGELLEPPKMETVKLNGVLIHEDVELKHHTGSAKSKGFAVKGPLMLQDHHHPVRYRNIWVQPL